MLSYFEIGLLYRDRRLFYTIGFHVAFWDQVFLCLDLFNLICVFLDLIIHDLFLDQCFISLKIEFMPIRIWVKFAEKSISLFRHLNNKRILILSIFFYDLTKTCLRLDLRWVNKLAELLINLLYGGYRSAIFHFNTANPFI